MAIERINVKVNFDDRQARRALVAFGRLKDRILGTASSSSFGDSSVSLAPLSNAIGVTTEIARGISIIDDVMPNVDKSLVKKLGTVGVVTGAVGGLVYGAGELVAVAGSVGVAAMGTAMEILESSVGLLETVGEAISHVSETVPNVDLGLIGKLATTGIVLGAMGGIVYGAGALVAEAGTTGVYAMEAAMELLTESLVLMEVAGLAIKGVAENVPQVDLGLVAKLVTTGAVIAGMGYLVYAAGDMVHKAGSTGRMAMDAAIELLTDSLALMEAAGKAIGSVDKHVPRVSWGLIGKLTITGITIGAMGGIVYGAGKLVHKAGSTGRMAMDAAIELLTSSLELLKAAGKAIGSVDRHVPRVSWGLLGKLTITGVTIAAMGGIVYGAGILVQKAGTRGVASMRLAIELLGASVGVLEVAGAAIGSVARNIPNIGWDLVGKLTITGVTIAAMGGIVYGAGILVRKAGTRGVASMRLAIELLGASVGVLEVAGTAIRSVSQNIPNIGWDLVGKLTITGVTIAAMGGIVYGAGLLVRKAGTRGVGAMWTATALLNASMGVLETAGQAIRSIVRNVPAMRERAVAQRMVTVAAVLASMVGLTVAVGALTKSKVGGLAMVLGGIMTYGLMLLLEQIATSIGHLVANVPPISDNVIGILTTMGLALLAIAGWGTLAGLAGAIGGLLAGLTVQNIRLFERTLEFFTLLGNVDIPSDLTETVRLMGETLTAIGAWGTLAGLSGAIGGFLSGFTASNLDLFQQAMEFFVVLAEVDSATLDRARENVRVIGTLLNEISESMSMTVSEVAGQILGAIGTVFAGIQLDGLLRISEILTALSAFDSSVMNDAEENIGELQAFLESFTQNDAGFWETLGGLFESAITAIGSIADSLTANAVARSLGAYVEIAESLQEIAGLNMEAIHDDVIEQIGMIQSVMSAIQGEEGFWDALEEMLVSLVEARTAENIVNTIAEFISIVESLGEFKEVAEGFTAASVTGPISEVKAVMRHLRGEQSFWDSLIDFFSSWLESQSSSNVHEMVEDLKAMVISFQEIDELGYTSSWATRNTITAVQNAIEQLEEFVDDRSGTSGRANVINYITDTVAAFNGLIQSLLDLTPKFTETGEAYGEQMIAGFDDAQVKYHVSNKVTEMIGALGEKVTYFTALGESYGNYLATAFGTAIQAVNTYLSTAISSLDNTVTRMIARSVGVSLGSEIASGIQSQLNNITVPTIGNVQGFSSGGVVGFPARMGTDTIPAMLTYGEFVMRKQAVDRFGSGFFNKLNEGDAKGAFRSLIPRYTVEAFEYPSVSSIINNYSTSNSNNQNSNNVTIHTKTDNPAFITSHFERWT